MPQAHEERLLLQDAQALIDHAIRQRPHLRSELKQVRLVIPELTFDGDVTFDLGGLECTLPVRWASPHDGRCGGLGS